MLRCVQVLALLAALTIEAPRGAAASQDPDPAANPMAAYLGQPIVSLSVTLVGRPTAEPALVDLIEIRAGQPLSARDVRDSIAHLFSLGRFEDVRVYAAPAAGGVALRIELMPVHSVGRMAFTGTIGLDEALLRRTIAERFGVTPAAARAGDVARTLSGLYRDHGYLKARIEPHVTVEHRDERTTLTFEIDAGPRLTVANVRFDGNAPGTLAQAEAQLGFVAGQP
jgi:outer membrane protein insertion porin family